MRMLNFMEIKKVVQKKNSIHILINKLIEINKFITHYFRLFLLKKKGQYNSKGKVETVSQKQVEFDLALH